MEWPVSGYTQIRDFGADPAGTEVLARHDASGSLVVIRFLPAASLGEPGMRAQARADAHRLAGLQHSGVARLLEYVETDRGVAIVREHVEGVTLRTLLGEEGALGPQAALTVLKGMLLALAAAHARGVLHRGCTPASVLITRIGGVVLTGFGTTGALAAQSLPSGTYFYLAPERWDTRQATPSADLYAATATCFECIAGAPPFFSDDRAELRSGHENTPPPVGVIPEAVRVLLGRGLAKAPTDRPADAAEYLAELEEAAVRGYGADWETLGRTELAELAAGTGPSFHLDPENLARTPGQSALSRYILGGFRLGRSGRIAAAVTFTLILGLTLAVTVPGGDFLDGAGEVFSFEGDSNAPHALGSSHPLGSSKRGSGEFVPSLVASGAMLPLAVGGTGMTLFSLAAQPHAGAFAPMAVRRLLDPFAATPLAAPSGSRVSDVSLSSFERRGSLTRLVVRVTTTGSGPVQLILGYGTSRGAGPGQPSMIITRTLAGRTSYSVTDYRTLPASCAGSAFVLVTTSPAPDTGSRFAELPLACPVPATPHSGPPPASGKPELSTPSSISEDKSPPPSLSTSNAPDPPSSSSTADEPDPASSIPDEPDTQFSPDQLARPPVDPNQSFASSRPSATISTG
ncbi:MAG: protein kinase [Actinomycetota bacterium]|nr:protein kinase [Actinomycetota bacterium]